MVTFFISLLIACVVTFLFGFLAGYQRGEQSINVRLRYVLLKNENAMLKLAFKNAKEQLHRIKHGVPEPLPDPFDYGQNIGMEDEDIEIA